MGLERLATVIPQHIEAFILNIPIPGHFSLDDGWSWNGATSRVYSSVAGYCWWLERNYGWNPGTSWRWLWQLKCLEKIKLLLCLALHEGLPTNGFRFKRNLCSSQTCPRCDAAPEYPLCCFRDCIFSVLVWRALGFFNANIFLNQELAS